MSARSRLAAAATLFAITFIAVACSGGMSPTAPSSTPTAPTQILNVAGSWNGTSTDSQGATVVDWTITQTGNAVSGTVRTNAPDPTDGSCNSCHRNKSGTFTGTVNGNVLTMAMQFAAGANGDPTPICSATMTGSATSSADGRLGGAYTGSDTCEGSFLNGSLTMTRK
jgi:hypothetical protein